ncbi:MULTISPECIES: hypothetical protein [Aphanothece]|uniref:hypothetical protein n=1 Tax=Aphanothece TaxID=1121 RepID=UPI00398F103F
MVRVRRKGTIEVRQVTSSVTSLLIGQLLTLRLDRLDLFLRSQFIEMIPHLHQCRAQAAPLDVGPFDSTIFGPGHR